MRPMYYPSCRSWVPQNVHSVSNSVLTLPQSYFRSQFLIPVIIGNPASSGAMVRESNFVVPVMAML